MLKILTCRRTFIAFYAITGLIFLGYYGKLEVAGSIATIAIGLAGANAFEGHRQKSGRNDD